MFALFKFVWIVFRAFPALMNVRTNALASVPDPTKWLAMVMLSSFWALAFTLYIGELALIGYNILGHIAIVTMVFVTWHTFRSLNRTNARGADYLRMPDYSSRCDELTDEQRTAAADRADALLTKQV